MSFESKRIESSFHDHTRLFGGIFHRPVTGSMPPNLIYPPLATQFSWRHHRACSAHLSNFWLCTFALCYEESQHRKPCPQPGQPAASRLCQNDCSTAVHPPRARLHVPAALSHTARLQTPPSRGQVRGRQTEVTSSCDEDILLLPISRKPMTLGTHQKRTMHVQAPKLNCISVMMNPPLCGPGSHEEHTQGPSWQLGCASG